MAELFAYTDGACSGNPGPGGWGVLMQAKDGQTVLKQRDLKGGEAVEGATVDGRDARRLDCQCGHARLGGRSSDVLAVDVELIIRVG